MTERRPYAAALERLRAAGLRPTRQRLALTRLLFAGTDRHVTGAGERYRAKHQTKSARNRTSGPECPELGVDRT